MNDDVPHETDVAVVGAVAWQLFVEIVVVGLGSVAVASGELGLGRPLRRVLHHRSARTVTFRNDRVNPVYGQAVAVVT